MKKIIVVKVGRSIATTKRDNLDTIRIEHLVRQIKELQAHDISVILVFSAALTCGRELLGSGGDSAFREELIGGVGQSYVTAKLYEIFRNNDLRMAQMMVTRDDFEDKKRRTTIKDILKEAAERKVVVMMNENDVIDLHTFDGNDYLASEVALLTRADSLLFLTDVLGVFDEDMRVIHVLSEGSKMADIKKAHSKGELGGMKGKVSAAFKASKGGVTSWITFGKTENLLTRLVLENEHLGTKMEGGK